MKDRIQIEAIEIAKPLPLTDLDEQGVPVAAADLFHGEAQGGIHGNSVTEADDPSDDEITVPGRDGFDDKFPFEAMKLKVGDRMQLQLPELLSHDRVIVRLIGYVNNLGLLVTTPRDAKGFRIKVLENDSLVVRVFTSQNAFGFSATVSKIIKIPFEYLHLTFPAEVKGVIIRKAPRVRTRIICSAVAEPFEGEGLPGLLVNLSANGALLDSRQEIAAKGAMIGLSFIIKLHAVDALLTIKAIVRSQFVDETSGTENSGIGVHIVHHGLEFVDLTPNDSLILQSMIYQQMIEHPKTVL